MKKKVAHIASCSPLVKCQHCGGDVRVLTLREHATMQDAPAGISSRCVDHLAYLIVGKVVANPAASFSPMAGLTQQETLQGFIQGGQSLLRGKLGDLAELLKGEIMAEDRPCCQEVACRGRKLGQATQDHLAHIRGKHAVRWRGFHDRWLRLK